MYTLWMETVMIVLLTKVYVTVLFIWIGVVLTYGFITTLRR